jgi:uncharacterized protein
MNAPTSDLVFADARGHSRYEARLGGEVVGVADYRLSDDRIIFVHTEVDPAQEGQGVGGRLARFALEDARERGLRVVPRCPFIRSWIEKHDAYADLVAH